MISKSPVSAESSYNSYIGLQHTDLMESLFAMCIKHIDIKMNLMRTSLGEKLTIIN